MSTCNYYTTEEWAPLVVYEADDADAERWAYEDAAEAAADYNDGLRWYRVEVRGGYYTGIQFDIIEQPADVVADDWLEAIDDEAARYWYDMSAEELRASVKSEREAIKKWLRGWIGAGWLELGRLGTFSNGEAVYYQIAPRKIRVEGPNDEGQAVQVAIYSTAGA